MRRRLGQVLPALLALVTIACSAPNPDEVPMRASDARRPSAKTTRSVDAGAPAADGDGNDVGDDGIGSDDIAPTPVGDAGLGKAADSGAADAAVVDGGAGAGAFAGAPAYAPRLGPSARDNGHAFGGPTPTNPAGQACLACHGNGGNGPAFGFAGTVYATAAAAAPAARVEVRVRDKNGKAISAFTDADGNFFVPLNPNGDLVFPALTGGRDQTTTHPMIGEIANGNCNSCHSPGGGQARIYVP